MFNYNLTQFIASRRLLVRQKPRDAGRGIENDAHLHSAFFDHFANFGVRKSRGNAIPQRLKLVEQATRSLGTRFDWNDLRDGMTVTSNGHRTAGFNFIQNSTEMRFCFVGSNGFHTLVSPTSLTQKSTGRK